MTPTVSEFEARFADLACLHDESAIATALAEAGEMVGGLGETVWLYAAAHLLVMRSEMTAAPDGGSGVVTAETIGPRSVRYAPPVGVQFWERSYYGRMVLELQRRSPRRVFPRVLG